MYIYTYNATLAARVLPLTPEPRTATLSLRLELVMARSIDRMKASKSAALLPGISAEGMTHGARWRNLLDVASSHGHTALILAADNGHVTTFEVFFVGMIYALPGKIRFRVALVRRRAPGSRRYGTLETLNAGCFPGPGYYRQLPKANGSVTKLGKGAAEYLETHHTRPSKELTKEMKTCLSFTENEAEEEDE